MALIEEISEFLRQSGCDCSVLRSGPVALIRAKTPAGKDLFILPTAIRSKTLRAAEEDWAARKQALSQCSGHPISIVEDRWRRLGETYKMKLAAHIGMFRSVFARNCEVRKISKAEAAEFLQIWHNYGSASCRYCYGLFEKESGALVAVATFSNARRWVKPEGMVRSYEWVRYASPADVRVVGGMGKLMQKFIDDVSPDDIMSYADLEWSSGEVYRRLGFVEDGVKEPVLFRIDSRDWSREGLRGEVAGRTKTYCPTDREKNCPTDGIFYYKNFGSIKYRLKIIR